MGERPLGWYTGRDSPNTRRLVVDDGRLLRDSDGYGDDSPLWMKVRRTDGTVVPHLVVPTRSTATTCASLLPPQGFSHAEPFFQCLRDSFDTLYAEGDPNGLDRPKMLSIGMHSRLLGGLGALLRCSASWTTWPRTRMSGCAAASTSHATGWPSMLPPKSLRAFPPAGGHRQWPGQARSAAVAGVACSAAF